MVIASCSGDDPLVVLPDADGTRSHADSTATDSVSQGFTIHDEWDANDVSY